MFLEDFRSNAFLAHDDARLKGEAPQKAAQKTARLKDGV